MGHLYCAQVLTPKLDDFKKKKVLIGKIVLLAKYANTPARLLSLGYIGAMLIEAYAPQFSLVLLNQMVPCRKQPLE